MTAKYGVPYFANYVGSGMDSSDIRSMCPLSKYTKVPFKIAENKKEISTIDCIYKKYLENPDLNLKV
jgi:hypothetical protein